MSTDADVTSPAERLRVAVFAGPAATILNSEPLVTGDGARRTHGLGRLRGQDVLRPQRLAAPVTVYIEQFSAHPLERDAADLYGPPDGFVGPDGRFRREQHGPDDVPVLEVTLRPEDGVYPLPYAARQATGDAWEGDEAQPLADRERTRQPFYPDAARVFEEIDRLGAGAEGTGSLLSSLADFDFIRALPPGGYARGLAAEHRSDLGHGSIPSEVAGIDYFPYRPYHIPRSPSRRQLANVANEVQQALATGRYVGGVWLEGSPTVEETTYWLGLLVDTTLPIVGVASQRPHGAVGNDGDRNIVDAVRYVTSGAWADDAGRDQFGVVMIQDEQIFTSREVQKLDARPGGYAAVGGYGGIVGRIQPVGPPIMTFRPLRRHTSASLVSMRALPATVLGVRSNGQGAIERAEVRVKDDAGALLPDAIPFVSIAKSATYLMNDESADPSDEVEIRARVDWNLRHAPLSGIVGEGLAPYGTTNEAMDAALRRAVLSGIPVVKVGRGTNDGFPQPAPLFIRGSNLSATKARMLLIACLLRLGSLPPAADPDRPSPRDLAATQSAISRYQELFDQH